MQRKPTTIAERLAHVEALLEERARTRLETEKRISQEIGDVRVDIKQLGRTMGEFQVSLSEMQRLLKGAPDKPAGAGLPLQFLTDLRLLIGAAIVLGALLGSEGIAPLARWLQP